jgi:hypothetical protein
MIVLVGLENETKSKKYTIDINIHSTTYLEAMPLNALNRFL